MLTKFMSKKTCLISDLAQLIGKLVAACPAIEYGLLYTRLLEREKLLALIINDYDYDKTIIISQHLLSELDWWRASLKNSINSIKSGNFQMIIYTDASTTGWGAVNGNERIHGFWNESEKRKHINYLELLTVYLALCKLAIDVRNCQILLRIDNTTAISYINKMGGVRYMKYNSLARKIWKWAEDKNIFLFASYIASKDNVEADTLSRLKNNDGEWELASFAFKEIVTKFGRPEIDLFATNLNKKCNRFASWYPEPNSEQIDAFTFSWSDLNFYAFPPFILILRTLVKIKQDKACGIVVVPDWPNQPWEIIGKAFLKKGVPQESLEIMIASLANSTIKQYESSLRQWKTYCERKDLNLFEPTCDNVIQFLTECFRTGASYGTLNSHRSAISLISENKIGEASLITRFLKGVFRLKPARPRYAFTWDVSIVLRHLETLSPLKDLSLRVLTQKTAMLLALCTAQRAQTLTSITINNIIKLPGRLEIRVPDIIKTSGPGKFQPLLIIPAFIEKPELCLMHSVIRYLEVTAKLRGNIQQLFITTRKPYRAINTQTFSQWIKSVLRESKIDTSIFSSSHSSFRTTSPSVEDKILANKKLTLISVTNPHKEKYDN
ncbi:uncharacterized protein [Linepithema humile]|uniref:uncharacterized protein n=1 Tax=Linepithema humile TaxID=83485 RepID=UPI00351DB702